MKAYKGKKREMSFFTTTLIVVVILSLHGTQLDIISKNTDRDPEWVFNAEKRVNATINRIYFNLSQKDPNLRANWTSPARRILNLIELKIKLNVAFKNDDDKKPWISPAKEYVDFVKRIPIALFEAQCALSDYDDIYRKTSDKYGTDWRLMSAIGYVESRFKSHAISKSGAVGVMQIMPRIGAMFGHTEIELLNPEISIDIANRHYLDIERMLKIPHGTSNHDCICLILASYNGGIGHLFDAQRLTRADKKDPHKWDYVKYRLVRLRFEEVYTNPLVKFGEFKGARYTLAYVRDVMLKYNEYIALRRNAPVKLYPCLDKD
ncbi:MAG: transglycosylase SLT domain-containing protein [Rikenellaceae bacterium]